MSCFPALLLANRARERASTMRPTQINITVLHFTEISYKRKRKLRIYTPQPYSATSACHMSSTNEVEVNYSLCESEREYDGVRYTTL
jgi:hypothetical protein